jgi:hypothetical protein
MIIGPSNGVGLKLNSGKAVNADIHEHVHVNVNVQLCAPRELGELRAAI